MRATTVRGGGGEGQGLLIPPPRCVPFNAPLSGHQLQPCLASCSLHSASRPWALSPRWPLSNRPRARYVTSSRPCGLPARSAWLPPRPPQAHLQARPLNPGRLVTPQVQAVYDLLDRVLPGSKDHFTLSFNTGTCPGIVVSAPPTGWIGAPAVSCNAPECWLSVLAGVEDTVSRLVLAARGVRSGQCSQAGCSLPRRRHVMPFPTPQTAALPLRPRLLLSSLPASAFTFASRFWVAVAPPCCATNGPSRLPQVLQHDNWVETGRRKQHLHPEDLAKGGKYHQQASRCAVFLRHGT